MWWASLILGLAGLVVMGRGVKLVVDGRRQDGRRSGDAEQRMGASLRVVSGVKMINRGAVLVILALVLLLALA